MQPDDCGKQSRILAGVAVVIYGLVGIFGAARYGQHTEGDLLVNDWLGGGRGEGALDAAVVVYLAISMPPIQVCQKPQPHIELRPDRPLIKQPGGHAGCTISACT